MNISKFCLTISSCGRNIVIFLCIRQVLFLGITKEYLKEMQNSSSPMRCAAKSIHKKIITTASIIRCSFHVKQSKNPERYVISFIIFYRQRLYNRYNHNTIKVKILRRSCICSLQPATMKTAETMSTHLDISDTI